MSPFVEVGGPSRILVLGSGGREHALAWSLARETAVQAVVVAPGSDGIGQEPKVRCVPGVAATDPVAVVRLATAEDVDLVVVGPEAPLAAGVVDALMDAGVPTFGPTAAAARIETSKAFCREAAAAAGVRMARGEAFDSFEPALALARELASAPGSGGVVVKADGLAAGKGVTVCDEAAQAEAALRALFGEIASPAGPSPAGPSPAGPSPAGPSPQSTVVVVEERLFGAEASLIAICDDHEAVALPPARDHKRLLDADRGPNTGGMGAYSPVPDLPESLCATLVDVVHLPILAELERRGVPFRGALYAGLMLTPEGPVLLECNARFGDPEAQALLPRLAVPLGPLLLGAALGDLAGALGELGLSSRVLPTTGGAAVAVVLAAAGYPDQPRRGDEIAGLAGAAATGALVFHAGTSRGPGGEFRTSGGRILAVVGQGDSLPRAREQAERAADLVDWEGMQRRRDIASVLPPGREGVVSPDEGVTTAEAYARAGAGASDDESEGSPTGGTAGRTGESGPAGRDRGEA